MYLRGFKALLVASAMRQTREADVLGRQAMPDDASSAMEHEGHGGLMVQAGECIVVTSTEVQCCGADPGAVHGLLLAARHHPQDLQQRAGRRDQGARPRALAWLHSQPQQSPACPKQRGPLILPLNRAKPGPLRAVQQAQPCRARALIPLTLQEFLARKGPSPQTRALLQGASPHHALQGAAKRPTPPCAAGALLQGAGPLILIRTHPQDGLNPMSGRPCRR